MTVGGEAGTGDCERSERIPVPDSRSRSARFANVGWMLTVCPDALEAGGGFLATARRRPALGQISLDPAAAKDRSCRVASQRARGQIRRYCVANRLNRLGTLTYSDGGCHDPIAVRSHVHQFFRTLRAECGGKPFPYLWVPEWHKQGHGLHIHFAVGRYLKRSRIEEAWGRGFVHIKLLGNLPQGSGPQREAAVAARYLAKYVGKDVDREVVGAALHRYEVAQGFQPERTRLWGASEAEVIRRANALFGGPPSYVWKSNDTMDWVGPPAMWMTWL